MILGSAIRRAARQALVAGEVVAYPTEAVWGLGCDPRNETALRRVLTLKQRDPAKGLIVVASHIDQLEALIIIPSRAAYRRARLSWPGPNTWVFPAGPQASPWLTGAHDTLAVRVSAHPVVRALCEAWGGPLVSTSANRAGQPPATSRTQVQLRFPGTLVVPGALGSLARPTPIREAATGHYLRQ